jgi:ankyrin repeat protein
MKCCEYDHRGFTAIERMRIALEDTCYVIVDNLLQNNGDIEGKENNGRTPLHYAAENDCWKLAKFFIEFCNADIIAKDLNGITPLCFARIHFSDATEHYLMSKNASI